MPLDLLDRLRLEVAVDTRRVDRHFALVCIHEEGLSSHLQVGQGRNEYFVLVGVLRQERQAGAAVNVADIKLEEHRHLLAAEEAHRHRLVCGCGEEAEVNAAASAPLGTLFEASWQFDATNPATHLAARGNDADLGELAQEGIAGVDQVGVGVALEVRLRLLPELLGGWAACV